MQANRIDQMMRTNYARRLSRCAAVVFAIVFGSQTCVADDTFSLGSGKLHVILSVDRPLIVQYQSADGKQLSGDSSGDPLRASIRNTASGRYSTVSLRDPSCFSLQRQEAEARYSTRVSDNGTPAASFDLVYRLEDMVLRIQIERVKEESGYQLIDVFLPQIISAQGPTGQLIVPTQSGRLVHLDRSAPGRHVVGMNWFEADLCGAVVGDNCAAAIRTRNWDNELDATVTGVLGRLSGGYAVRMCLRAKVDPKAPSIPLAEKPSVEVAFVGQAASGERVGWVDAAKWLRQEVKGSPNPLYQDSVIYKIFCDSPEKTDYTTFEDALGIVRKVHQVAPWLKQVVYLVGWQYRGHDTGYPATDQINQRLGGIAGLRHLATEAAKFNATISCHDNFDDAYRDSPQWDESVVARDEAGNPQQGGVWAGGQSYILAFQKYARKAGLERVRRTVGQMPVRDTYHLDVLSAVPLRRDYNIASPENTRDSLEGKFAIVREFNRLGVDVTSEGFTSPFVGVIGHAWQLWRKKESLFAGEEMIPFIPMIYHGGPTTYGGGNPSADYARDHALYGATYSTDLTKHVDIHDVAESIYLVVAPWTHLRDRKMQDYRRQGDLCRVTYDKDTFVETNESPRRWRVVVDGATVVENDLAVIRKKDLVAVYSQTAQRTTVSLPEHWRGKNLKVTNACTGADITSQTTRAAAEATLDLPAREPILIGLFHVPVTAR